MSSFFSINRVIPQGYDFEPCLVFLLNNISPGSALEVHLNIADDLTVSIIVNRSTGNDCVPSEIENKVTWADLRIRATSFINPLTSDR